MMAKITKGTSFGGCVRYVLNEEKAHLLEVCGVNGIDQNQMINDFELQTMLNTKVKNVVGHISLNFPVEDAQMAKDDDLMVRIAGEYMELMGIRNTQYLIARHTDKDHHHCHIVFNRVDNDGKTISDKNDRYRNEKACKMLTAKHRLHFSEDKKNVCRENLRGEDALRYHIHDAISAVLPHCRSWQDLQYELSDRGIETKFKLSRQTKEFEGVKFEYEGHAFSGSKVDRKFSFMNLDNYFYEKELAPETRHQQAAITPKADPPQQQPTETVIDSVLGAAMDIAGGLGGILSPSPNSGDDINDPYVYENDLKKRKKKEKAKRKGRSI